MHPTIIAYIGFLVAVLILIWASIEFSRRISRRQKMDRKTLNTWVRLDSPRTNTLEEPLPDADDDDQGEIAEQNIHTRAQQNGHSSERKKRM